MDGYRPHLPTGLDPFEVLGVVDVGDVYVLPGQLEGSINRIADVVTDICKAGKVPIILGGDHSITVAQRPWSRQGSRFRRGCFDPLRRTR